jgi:hypothetical protein
MLLHAFVIFIFVRDLLFHLDHNSHASAPTSDKPIRFSALAGGHRSDFVLKTNLRVIARWGRLTGTHATVTDKGKRMLRVFHSVPNIICGGWKDEGISCTPATEMSHQ